MNKRDAQRQQVSHRRKTALLYIFIFLFGVLFKAFPLAGPVFLDLNTVIPASNEFKVTGGNSIAVTLGSTKTVGYTYVGNNSMYLTITGANSSGTQMRMKNTTANYYIPYTMTFDYDGAGSAGQTTVTHGFKKLMGGFSSSTGYNLTGTFKITTTGTSESYLEGDYLDTITFTFTTN